MRQDAIFKCTTKCVQLLNLVKYTILVDMAKKFITTEQAAEQLNVHRSTLTRWVQAGKVKPAVKGEGIRGEMFFYQSEINRVKRSLERAA